MTSNSPRRWPLLLGLAAIITLAGGIMWFTNRARRTAGAVTGAQAETPALAALPALDLPARAQVETATFSMG